MGALVLVGVYGISLKCTCQRLRLFIVKIGNLDVMSVFIHLRMLSSCRYSNNTKQETMYFLSSMIKVRSIHVQLFVWLLIGMHFKMCKLEANPKQTIGYRCFVFFSICETDMYCACTCLSLYFQRA